MKTILLERLILRNFKGFREFALITNDGNLDVYGDNGTGKTTLFDAFTWLLFGKDSENRTEQKFEIKELDSTGRVRQHKLEHEVEGVLIVNGRRKSFRRVYSEKWTKKRGSITDTFEGHETSYFIDGVPVLKKEYEAEVAAIIPEELFKLLTSPTYFNEQLKKDERRKVLLEISGEITNAEIIYSNKELEPLNAILQEREVEDHKKVIQAQMKRINQAIKDIPVRISEAQRSMPDVSDLSEEMLREDIESLRGSVQEKEKELIRVQSGGQTAELEKRLREIESQQLDIKARLQTEVLDQVVKQREVISSFHRESDRLQRELEDARYKIERNTQRISELDQERDKLRAEFTAVNAEEFKHTADDDCPACGQLLPEDRRKEAHEKALVQFNQNKAQRIENIQKRGRAAKEESEKLSTENVHLQNNLEKASDHKQKLEGDISSAEVELERLRGDIQDPSMNPNYQLLQKEAEDIKVRISKLHTDTAETQQQIAADISGLRLELSALESELAKFDQVRKQRVRIEELEAEEKLLATEYEKLQHELYLVEEFTRTKFNLLQSRIDSKFKLASFRLFKQQVNGGLEECCDTLYNGVPYDGGLNNAARINVGLDIINTLSQHYGVSAPIFIDNAEAVTKLIDTNTQVIRLVVSETDKKIRVEGDERFKEAI